MSAFSQVQLIDFEEKPYDSKEENGSKRIYLAGEEYRHFDGKSWKLPSVELAEAEIRKEAPVIAGYIYPNMYDFSMYATKFALGENSPAIKEDRVHFMQTTSGTAALRLGAEFLVSLLGKTVYYYSNPTWDTLHLIFRNADFKEARPYRYWCAEKNGIDFSGLLEDLKNAPGGAVIVLQPSVHNPTGTDLSKEQWKEIANVMKERKLIPFFDSAFQGLGINLEEDAWAIRYFVEQGFELFCAQSFSKNFGLYDERIGNVIIVTKNKELKKLAKANLDTIVRGTYMSSQAQPNRIISRICSSIEMKKQWMQDLQTMKNRITEARKLLRAALERNGTPGNWTFLTTQTGWHSIMSINEKQVEFLAKQHQVYFSKNGSFNISAITLSNVEYVAKAIHEAVTSLPN